MKRIYHIAVLICLIGLSGCGHIIRWAERNFDQGETVESVSKVPYDYIRSAHVHRQFSTSALIDALWLSDEVRTLYAQTYGLKNGKNDVMTKAFLRRQLEENKHFISFYVLTNFSLNIGDQHNTWALFLTVDDITVAPNEIRTTELTPEFKAFFGKRYNRFKSVYLVKFNAKTPDGKSLITETSQTMDLHFRSIEKAATLTWPVISDRNDGQARAESSVNSGVTETPEIPSASDTVSVPPLNENTEAEVEAREMPVIPEGAESNELGDLA